MVTHPSCETSETVFMGGKQVAAGVSNETETLPMGNHMLEETQSFHTA